MSEQYIGVKFHPLYRQQIPPEHPALATLKHWCSVFDREGLAPPYPGGSYGNLSFRTERSSFIITGTSIGLKNDLENGCFVEIHTCDQIAKTIEITGVRAPSSETFMHSLIYQARPDIHAIFHGHNVPITDHALQLAIPETPQAYDYGTIDLAQGAAQLAESADFFVIKEHGFVALGTTMEEAGKLSLLWLQKVRQALW